MQRLRLLHCEIFTMRSFIKSVVLFCVLILCVTATTNPLQAAEKSARPNIVLMMCDDLGFSDLGCYGSEIRTPNLDQLASQGMRFTQFYNCAVCVTTRAALVTGLHPRRRDGKLLHEDSVTLGEVMRDAGYRTSLTGKWHLGSTAPRRPTDRGFEEYYGVASGCCNYFDPHQADPVFYNGGKRRPFLHNEKPVTKFPNDYYMTDAFTDHAIEQINIGAKDSRPFFVHVCFTAPHFPLHAKPEDIAKYKGKYDAGYMKLREQRYKRQIELGIIDAKWKLSTADKSLGEFRYDYDITPWEKVEDLTREKRRMEVYAGMVDSLDQGVGRIMEALKKANVDDNTLVMFLSDNGGCASYPGYADDKVRAGHAAYNKELPGGKDTYDFCAPGWGWAQCAPFRRYKVWTYEGGIATPMIARWPATIKPGSMTDQVGHVVDFLPTVLELGKGKYPATNNGKAIPPAEGKSLVPIFQGRQRAGHDYLCWYLFGNRAVRHGKWKLVWGVSTRKWELYDMQTDRTETVDLAKKHPQRVERMSAEWLKWAKRTGTPLTGNRI